MSKSIKLFFFVNKPVFNPEIVKTFRLLYFCLRKHFYYSLKQFMSYDICTPNFRSIMETFAPQFFD